MADVNGRYFVFYNPKTRKTIYIDPQAVGHPAPVVQNGIHSTKPDDAPYSYAIGNIGKDLHAVIKGLDSSTDQNFLHRDGIAERLNADTFIWIFQASGGFVIDKYKNGIGDSETFIPNDFIKNLKSWTFLEKKGDLIVFKGILADGTEGEYVFNFVTWKLINKDQPYTDVKLSANGKYFSYITHRDPLDNPEHHVYDTTNSKSYLKQVFGNASTHPQSDVIRVMDADTKKFLFEPGESSHSGLMSRQDDIYIDSTGTIAIGRTKEGLKVVNLKAWEPIVESADNVWVSSDKDFVYCIFTMMGSPAAAQVWKFDKHIGKELSRNYFPSGHPNAYPRFMESFGLDKMSIYDWQEKKSVVATTRSNYQLMGDKYVMELPDSFVVHDLTTNNGVKFRKPNPEASWEVLSLSGGKVWLVRDRLRKDRVLQYSKFENGQFTHALSFEVEAIGKAFVNETQDFILQTGPTGIVSLLDSQGKSTNITDKLPAGFAPVDVNGRYFVFTSPDGELRFIDPQALIPKSLKTPVTKDPITTQKPACATQQFEIIREGDEYVVRDSKSGETSMTFQRLDRVNENTIIGHYRSGSMERLALFKSVPGGPGGVFEMVPLMRNGRDLLNGAVKVIDLNKWFIIFEIERNGIKRQIVYNVLRGNVIDWGTDEMEYSLFPQAYAFVMKGKSRQYLYDQYSSKIGTDYDRIDFDATGRFAIGSRENTLEIFDLIEPTGTFLVQSVKIAADEKFTYLFIKDEGRPNGDFYVFDKDGNTKISALDSNGIPQKNPIDGNLPLPRFWEDYEPGKRMAVWELPTKSTVYTDPYMPYPEANPRVSLTGSIVTAYVDGPPGSAGIVDIKDLSDGASENTPLMHSDYEAVFLQGNKVLYTRNKYLKENGILYLKKEGKTFNQIIGNDFFGGIFINIDQTFLLVNMQNKGQFYLIDANAQVKNITPDIPAGYVPAGVNGGSFILANKADPKKILYLDPQVMMPPKETQISEEQNIERRRMLELWTGKVLPQREKFIAQAQNAYGPFFDLIPDQGLRDYVKESMAGPFEDLYQQQETEVLKRFHHALDNSNVDLGQELNQQLPFDHFSQRMGALTAALALSVYFSSVRKTLEQERYAVQQNFYEDLFLNLFQLSMNDAITLEPGAVNDVLFKCLALGWVVDTQVQLDALGQIHDFIEALEKYEEHISIGQLIEIISVLSAYAAKDPMKNTPIVIKQMRKILDLQELGKRKYLTELAGSLEPRIIYFLTNDVPPVNERTAPMTTGKRVAVPSGGVEISRLRALEAKRHKSGRGDVVMTMDYMKANIGHLPPAYLPWDKEISQYITGQGSRAYTQENGQNTQDETQQMQGELVVGFYRQKNPVTGEEEYAEDAVDNGPGASKPAALILPVSTKEGGGQVDTVGFFGRGKYTNYEGLDRRLEIISRSQEGSQMFTSGVFEDPETKIPTVKLTGIMEDVTDKRLPGNGVLVSRVQSEKNTIPELDKMLAMRAWKTNAGLAQNDHFKIFFDDEGKREPLIVEHEVLSETPFIAVDPKTGKLRNFGTSKVIFTKDMPLQVINRGGFREGTIKPEYLALIPPALRKHIEELGTNIQIPLSMIGSRGGFEFEDLKAIQEYVAIGFYKALAYRTFSQQSPQFVYEGSSSDWRTRVSYDQTIDPDVPEDAKIIDMANRFNQRNRILASGQALKLDQLPDVTNQELDGLLPKNGQGDIDRYLKFILLLEFPNSREPGKLTSLAAEREAYQELIRNVPLSSSELRRKGINPDDLPDIYTNPLYAGIMEHVMASMGMDKESRNIKEHIIPVEQYTPEDKKLLAFARRIIHSMGIEQIVLIEGTQAEGKFGLYEGKKTLFLNRSLEKGPESADKQAGFIDPLTDTLIHEPGHLFEKYIVKERGKIWEQGAVFHTGFTHQPVGPFADAMKHGGMLALNNYGKNSAMIIPHKAAKGHIVRHEGGIDFTSNKVNSALKIKDSGNEIKFHVDPAMLERLKNIPGFVPVIINIQPLKDLHHFLFD